MAKQMQDKVCVITGGAGSIGAASARLLRNEGAKIMLVDLSEAALKSFAHEIGGEEVAWCAADVTQSDQVRRAIAATVARFGKIASCSATRGILAPSRQSPTIPRMCSIQCSPSMSAAPSSVPSTRF